MATIKIEIPEVVGWNGERATLTEFNSVRSSDVVGNVEREIIRLIRHAIKEDPNAVVNITLGNSLCGTCSQRPSIGVGMFKDSCRECLPEAK